MKPMPKSYDPKILAYLKKPDNLPFVLEIGEYALKIREDMPNEVWLDIMKGLDVSRRKSKLGGDFTFDRPTNVELAKGMLNLHPWKSGIRTAPKLIFDIEMQE